MKNWTYLKKGWLSFLMAALAGASTLATWTSRWHFTNIMGRLYWISVNLTLLFLIVGLIQFIGHLHWTAPHRIQKYERHLRQKQIQGADERNTAIRGESAILMNKLMMWGFLALFLVLLALDGANNLRVLAMAAFFIHYIGGVLIYAWLQRKG